MKKTPWFSGAVPPFHMGEYEVHRPWVAYEYPKRTRLLWTGSEWKHTDASSRGRFAGAYAAMTPNCTWRGLAKKPT